MGQAYHANRDTPLNGGRFKSFRLIQVCPQMGWLRLTGGLLISAKGESNEQK
jgi:hypothetical protein